MNFQVNDKFGCLTVLETGLILRTKKHKYTACKCKCECGLIDIKPNFNLNRTQWRYCSPACLLKVRTFDSVVSEQDAMVKIGEVYNYIKVVSEPFYKLSKRPQRRNNMKREQYFVGECKCGKIKNFQCRRIVSGFIHSCGCKPKDVITQGTTAKDGMKTCAKCRISRPIYCFNKGKKGYDGLSYACKLCQRNQVLMKNYGITHDDYERILAEQGGKCGCCQKPAEICNDKTSKYLHVDHDHKTGKVRGILCPCCNKGIGKFYEDITILQNAINYLNKHMSCNEPIQA